MNIDGLFPHLAPVARETARKLIPVGHGYCPECVGDGRRHALYRWGRHIVWRDHHYWTWDDHKRSCRASGVAICTVKPRFTTITCPCQDET